MWQIERGLGRVRLRLTLTQLRFLMVGGSSFIVDMLLFICLSQCLYWPIVYARLMAFGVALTLTWFGNRLFTFSHRTKRPKGEQFMTAIVLACMAALVNLSIFYVLTELCTPTVITTPIFLALGVLSGLVVNWVGSNYFVFRNT